MIPSGIVGAIAARAPTMLEALWKRLGIDPPKIEVRDALPPAIFVYPSEWPDCRGLVEFAVFDGGFGRITMTMPPDRARAFASTILHQADLTEEKGR